MKKISPPPMNCFTLANSATLNPGIKLSWINGTHRGVMLSPRRRAQKGVPATRALAESQPHALRTTSLDSDGFLAEWDGQERVFLLVPAAYEVEHLRGAAPTTACFHDESLELGGSDGSLANRGRHPAAVLLGLSWVPRDGHFHDATALRLRHRGGEIAVGLSSVERLRNGWPILWCRTLHDYNRAMREATASLDGNLLRYGSSRRLLD